MSALRLAACGVIAFAAFVVSAGAASAVAVVPDGGFVIQGSTAEVTRQIDIAHDAGARWISLATTWEQLDPSRTAIRRLSGATSKTGSRTRRPAR